MLMLDMGCLIASEAEPEQEQLDVGLVKGFFQSFIK
jgi:hypothetical protein